MPDDAPHFDERGRLIAPKYDDLYFSAGDGLAEARHVFLEGNQLKERFAVLKPAEAFTIGETGFGTGLNFLAAWQLFEQHAPEHARLDFISIEGFPLDQETIRRALSPWHALKAHREALLQQWGPIWPGMQRFRLADGRIRLTILVGEVVDELSRMRGSVDAWFLDGFAPSRNPEMWSDEVFQQIARCSGASTTLATYTAAGFVRRGLASVGFEVEKQPGYGTKRDMTVGRSASRDATPPAPVLRPAVVVGGSLAGAFVARSLAERGVKVVVFERQRMYGGQLPALIPRHAVLQPKVSDISDPVGRWLREGFAYVSRWIESDLGLQRRVGWDGCGSFQVAHDERSERRLHRFCDQFSQTGLCRWVAKGQTEPVLGIPLESDGLAIDAGGILRPASLCQALLEHPHITVRDEVSVQALHAYKDRWVVQVDGANTGAEADQVIVANAMDALEFKQTEHFLLKPVRGQVTLLHGNAVPGGLGNLQRPLFYGGYVLPLIDGMQSYGASFMPGDDSSQWKQAEHDIICDQLSRVLPDEAEQLRYARRISGWAGVRTTTPGHRCYAEEVLPGLYVSLGHGSHGIASAARAAEHLASLITGGVVV